VIGYPLDGVIGGYAAQSWLLVPETPAFHSARRASAALPPIKASGPKPKVSDILSKPGPRKVTWLPAAYPPMHAPPEQASRLAMPGCCRCETRTA
jgi:hypothetical protein